MSKIQIETIILSMYGKPQPDRALFGGNNVKTENIANVSLV